MSPAPASPDDIAMELWRVGPPIILLLGTLGNILTFVVVRKASASASSGGASQSIFIFFAALATSDLVLLYSGLLRRWLQYQWGVDIRAFNDVTCKLDVYLVYLSGMTSSWFLVVMTVQRVLSVAWPYKIGLWCTRSKTLVAVGVIVGVLAVLNWHLLVNYYVITDVTDNYTSCMSDQSHPWLHRYDEEVFSWVDLAMSSVVPASLLIVLNAFLGYSVVRHARASKLLQAPPGASSSSVAASGSGSGSGSETRREKAASTLNVTLMCVSVAYLLLTFPLPMYQFVSYMMDSRWWRLYVAVTSMAWYLNSSINFYLYCLTGSRFREEFKRLLAGIWAVSCCCCCSCCGLSGSGSGAGDQSRGGGGRSGGGNGGGEGGSGRADRASKTTERSRMSSASSVRTVSSSTPSIS